MRKAKSIKLLLGLEKREGTSSHILKRLSGSERAVKQHDLDRLTDEHVENLHFTEAFYQASFLPLLFLTRGFSNSEETRLFTSVLTELSIAGLVSLPNSVSHPR